MDTIEKYDCQACGACCKFAGEIAVDIDGDEQVPRYLTRSVRSHPAFLKWEVDFFRRMLRDPDGSCAALCGEIGNGVRCTIYDRRPSVCRTFTPGGLDCLASRAAAGLDPPLTDPSLN